MGISADILEQVVRSSAEPLVIVRIDHPNWPVVLSNPAFDAIDWTAMLCNCIARFIHSDATHRRTSQSLRSTTKGASSMDSTIAASTGCIRSGCIRSVPYACASNTKPNSPAEPSARPTRIATPVSAPKIRARPKIRTVFAATSVTSSTATHAFSTTTRQSSTMPIVTKKSPSSTSRNGLMSSST